jgi:hypothetical protein
MQGLPDVFHSKYPDLNQFLRALKWKKNCYLKWYILCSFEFYGHLINLFYGRLIILGKIFHFLVQYCTKKNLAVLVPTWAIKRRSLRPSLFWAKGWFFAYLNGYLPTRTFVEEEFGRNLKSNLPSPMVIQGSGLFCFLIPFLESFLELMARSHWGIYSQNIFQFFSGQIFIWPRRIKLDSIWE